MLFFDTPHGGIPNNARSDSRFFPFVVVDGRLHVRAQGRKPSQQSYRIKSRRALKHNAGPRWAAKTMKNSIKRVALAYTTSRSE